MNKESVTLKKALFIAQSYAEHCLRQSDGMSPTLVVVPASRAGVFITGFSSPKPDLMLPQVKMWMRTVCLGTGAVECVSIIHAHFGSVEQGNLQAVKSPSDLKDPCETVLLIAETKTEQEFHFFKVVRSDNRHYFGLASYTVPGNIADCDGILSESNLPPDDTPPFLIEAAKRAMVAMGLRITQGETGP